MNIKTIGEIKLIERLKKRIRLDESVIVGPGDDAAVIRWTRDKFLLFTCDMIIEGVHFSREKAGPRRIGRKALAVNMSDIAAMGGSPKHAVVSLGLPGKTPLSFVSNMFSGMKSLADKFGINIVGGDVNSCDKVIIDVALLGEVREENLVKRSGAKPGDVILVTGSLGGAAFGKHLDFTPRVKEAAYLVRNFKINAMMDISDGLSGDLAELCRASRAGAVIYESLIPLSRKAKSVENALSDGEDFELLFTLPRESAARLTGRFEHDIGTKVTPIGEITSLGSIKIVDKSGRSTILKPTGFTHF